MEDTLIVQRIESGRVIRLVPKKDDLRGPPRPNGDETLGDDDGEPGSVRLATNDGPVGGTRRPGTGDASVCADSGSGRCCYASAAENNAYR
jgi:hypothetical protein